MRAAHGEGYMARDEGGLPPAATQKPRPAAGPPAKKGIQTRTVRLAAPSPVEPSGGTLGCGPTWTVADTRPLPSATELVTTCRAAKETSTRAVRSATPPRTGEGRKQRRGIKIPNPGGQTAAPFVVDTLTHGLYLCDAGAGAGHGDTGQPSLRSGSSFVSRC